MFALMMYPRGHTPTEERPTQGAASAISILLSSSSSRRRKSLKLKFLAVCTYQHSLGHVGILKHLLDVSFPLHSTASLVRF